MWATCYSLTLTRNPSFLSWDIIKRPMKMHFLRWKALLLFCLLASLSFYFLPPSHRIDKKEKFLIEALLQDMVFEQGFAYTLFGNKPVSLAGYFLVPSFDCAFFQKKHFPISEAWAALEKNILCHDQKNYTLLKQVDYSTEKNHIFQIILINRSSFLQAIAQHLGLFCELLGKTTTPKELLDEVLRNKKSLWDILHNSEALYGILLGYGKENSLAFKRRWELAQVFNPYCQNSQKAAPLYPKPSKGFQSAEEEYRYFETEHCFFDIHPSPLSPLTPPCFMVMKNHGRETELRVEEYKENFKRIIAIYAKSDFLSTTLDRLLQKRLRLTSY